MSGGIDELSSRPKKFSSIFPVAGGRGLEAPYILKIYRKKKNLTIVLRLSK